MMVELAPGTINANKEPAGADCQRQRNTAFAELSALASNRQKEIVAHVKRVIMELNADSRSTVE